MNATTPDVSRSAPTTAAIKQAFVENLYYRQVKFPAVSTPNDRYMAVAHTIRDQVVRRAMDTFETYYRTAARTVCYLSAEYLLGPHLGNNLINLGLHDQAREAITELGLNFDDLLEQEEEPGLGNGGLGRLAACYLDSLSTLQIPTIGYGIRYEFGIFDQAIRDGWQVEITDKWLRYGNPWEIHRPEINVPVGFGGHTRTYTDEAGRNRVEWVPERVVLGVAYDTPILGYKVGTANMLRLWQAQAVESFDFQAFNVGDYERAVNEKVKSENITKVLYPNDEPLQGKALRLQQQYFFVACSLKDMARIHAQRSADLSDFHKKYAAQLNDTHPAIAVAELMRLLVDEYAMDWDKAWDVTRQTFGYTNHTLLPEALETWSLDLFGRLLPRHLEIIFEINRRWLDRVRVAYPNDPGRIERMSLIDERGGKSVRMASLATVGSHFVNGVSALHSRLLTESVLKDFASFEPEKFGNVTNGITPRRFMILANPPLAALITKAIGDGWPADLEQLRKLEPLANDKAFRAEWRAVKRKAKERLAARIASRTGIATDPDALFDIQAKRFHEYKRQHLNVLHIISRYLRLKDRPGAEVVPRVFVFAGKAAPGYYMAKLIIKLIHSVAHVVNNDPDVRGRLRVAFSPDFNVQSAQTIYPGADLSEQISTAGKEASGTGNMKFALNGALTIGTLDGANVEMREHIGAENFFEFGLTTEQVAARQSAGYRPWEELEKNEELRRIIDHIDAGAFSGGNRDLFRPIVENLRSSDPFLVLADFAAYVECQTRVNTAYSDPENWAKKSILNVARMGWFSSDRSIREYCTRIWHVEAVKPESRASISGSGT
ncbi:MAG: glycogen phosphorylase [Planctomycetaceae bacterium]|nr:glycogen phosphorylase [Planctomycetaceae bacterium]